jgi:hypothetical protein
MQVAADWLAQQAQLGQDVFRRGQPEASAAVRGGDLTELLRAAWSPCMCLEEQAVAFRPRRPPLWTANDAIRQISSLLPGMPDPSPLVIFLPAIDSNAPKRALRCRVALASRSGSNQRPACAAEPNRVTEPTPVSSIVVFQRGMDRASANPRGR